MIASICIYFSAVLLMRPLMFMELIMIKFYSYIIILYLDPDLIIYFHDRHLAYGVALCTVTIVLAFH